MTTTREQRPITGDAEVLAVLVALAPLDDRIDRARLLNRREFDVEETLNQPWSSGERALVQLAGALWNGWGDVDITYLTCLDGRFRQAAFDAIAIRGRRDITTFGADAAEEALS